MAGEDESDDRALIRAVDEHLVAAYGTVVDDVVLRAWGNEQVELTHLLLTAAVASAGGDAEPADLWPVARAIAFRTAIQPARSRLAG